MSFKKILLSAAFIAVFGVYAIYSKYNSNSATLNNLQVVQTNTLPQSQPTPTQTQNSGQGKYKNGQYTGATVDAYYGLVQVKAIISGGQLTDIQFLNYPQDNGNSLSRSNYALPQLKTEAIQAQNANVNAISGATETSRAFMQSLASALSQAS